MRKLQDPRIRWNHILREISGEESIDDILEGADMDEGAQTAAGTARHAMAISTIKQPLYGRELETYDDSDDEKKVSKPHTYIDDIVESIMSDEILTEDEESKRRRISTIRNIRGQLEYVWQMLGKAETKLGVAKFDAEEQDFTGIEKTLLLLINRIDELMGKIEKARDKVSLA